MASLLQEKYNIDKQWKLDVSSVLNNLSGKIDGLSHQIEGIKTEKNSYSGLDESEASRRRLLAELASLKRDRSTHYDATSDRPQHHVLIGEYKTLKEQHLDPLARDLLKLMPQLSSEPKDKQLINNIKASISATVLIEGQLIMKGESRDQIEPDILEKLEDQLCKNLEIDRKDFSPEARDSLKRIVNITKSGIQYPVPGKWTEEIFQQISVELGDRLYKELKTETKKVIQSALHFLERAALADPSANLRLSDKDSSFQNDSHEAAKGWDDKGKILKTIYPAYLVNEEVKVKAVVLTE
jgi:hypothetical protein